MIEGEQIGSYRLEKRIGAGGMGEVWLAGHVLLPRRVAIKVLHAQYTHREEVVRRFFNEARAATSIADPGIVQIYDFGRHVDGSAYLVMELLDGETLDARMRRCAFRVEDALRVVRQVASSLGAAHARGIVHRDLKPENIFLVRDPEVAGGERAKILDFGIAKLAESRVKTLAAAVMGTPAFMSPEQCRGAAHVDARTDIYALGCVLFMLLTGRLPFEATGSGDMLVKHITVPAPRASLYAYVPPVVDELIACCLDKDPARRPATGHDLALALGHALHQLGMTTSPPLPVAAEVVAVQAPVTTTTLSGAAGAATPRRRSGYGLVAGIAVAAVLVAVAGAGTIALTAGGDTEARPATSQGPAEQLDDAMLAVTQWVKQHRRDGRLCPTAGDLALGRDPWGHDLVVRCTVDEGGSSVAVRSAGANGVLDDHDDLEQRVQFTHAVNWN